MLSESSEHTHASSLFDRMTLVCGPMGGADVNRTANPSNFYFLFCAALKTHAPELNKHRNFIKIIFFFKSKFKFEYIERAQTVTHLFECRWTGCCPSSDRRWMDHSVARCFRVNFFGNFQKNVGHAHANGKWNFFCQFQTGGSPFRFQRTCPRRCTCSHLNLIFLKKLLNRLKSINWFNFEGK